MLRAGFLYGWILWLAQYVTSDIPGIRNYEKLYFTLEANEVHRFADRNFSEHPAILVPERDIEQLTIVIYGLTLPISDSPINLVLKLVREEDFYASESIIEVIDQNWTWEEFGLGVELNIYSGDVKELAKRSRTFGSLRGYITKGIFVGEINIIGHTYYIEPAKRYGVDKKEYVNAILYKRESVDYDDLLLKECTTNADYCRTDPIPDSSIPSDPNGPDMLIPLINETTDIDPNSPKSCRVEVVIDHTYLSFTKLTESNVLDAIKKAVLHVKQASHMLLDEDFNADGLPDNVGLNVVKVTVFGQAVSYPMDGEIDDADTFLDKCSLRNTSSFCLSIVFTCRNFKNGIGGAYIGYTTEGWSKRDGGVCAYPRKINGILRYRNIVVVSCKKNGLTLPFSTVQTALIHQLGHSFGSLHDNQSDDKCTFSGAPYAMASQFKDGSLSSHHEFSLCSRNYISPVLQTKSYCLIDDSSSPNVLVIKRLRWVVTNWLFFVLVLSASVVLLGLAIGVWKYDRAYDKVNEFAQEIRRAEKMVLEYCPEYNRIEKKNMLEYSRLCRLVALFPTVDINELKISIRRYHNERQIVRRLVSKGYEIRKI